MKLRHIVAAASCAALVFAVASVVDGGRHVLEREREALSPDLVRGPRVQADPIAAPSGDQGVVHDGLPAAGEPLAATLSREDAEAAGGQPPPLESSPEQAPPPGAPVPPSASSEATAPVEVAVAAPAEITPVSTPVPPPDTAPDDVEPPTAPTIVAGEALSPSSIQLTWRGSTDDVGVTHFEVLRGDVVVVETASRSATIADLVPGDEHCFKVRSYDAAGRKSRTTPPLCIRTPDPTAPSTPERLVASALGEEHVVLQWAPSTDDVGVAGYEITRGHEVVASTAALRADEFGLKGGTRYCYTVTAVDVAGSRSAQSEEVCVVTPDLFPPAPPRYVHAVNVASRALRIAWEPAEDTVGVTAYEVILGDAVVGTSSDAVAEFAPVAQGRTGCYRVRALDAAGHRSAPSSELCLETPITDPPAAPVKLQAVANSRSSIGLSWSAGDAPVVATGYDVLRDGIVVASTTSSFWRDDKARAEREYCYAVIARNAVGMRSAQSEPTCAAIPRDAVGAPFALQVERAAGNRVRLSWQPSGAREIVYRVYDARGRAVGATAGATFDVASVGGAGAACFAIAAVDPEGRESARSAETCLPDASPGVPAEQASTPAVAPMVLALLPRFRSRLSHVRGRR